MISEDIPLGPVDYVVIEFPEANFTGEGLPILLDLVNRGIIRVLDAAFVKVNDDGSTLSMTVEDLDESGGEWQVMAGAASGMLSQDDFDEVGALLAPGAAAAILVYENTWAGPFASAMRRAGGSLVSFGRVSVQDLAAALDIATEELNA